MHENEPNPDDSPMPADYEAALTEIRSLRWRLTVANSKWADTAVHGEMKRRVLLGQIDDLKGVVADLHAMIEDLTEETTRHQEEIAAEATREY